MQCFTLIASRAQETRVEEHEILEVQLALMPGLVDVGGTHRDETRNRLCNFDLEARTEGSDELELWARLWAVGVALVLLHRLPFSGNHVERFLSALCCL